MKQFESAPSHELRRKTTIERLAGVLAPLVPSGPIRRWARNALVAIMDAGARHRGLECIAPGGERFRVLSAARNVTINDAEYHAFRGATRAGSVALDVGANIGAYTLLLSRWVGAKGRVFAFEPDPAVHRALIRHVELNAARNVSALPLAVSAAPGTVPFVAQSISGISHIATMNDAAAAQVPAVSIDSFCRQEKIRPSFLKIDVEGFEVSVLEGAKQTIREMGAELQVFVEMHPSIWPTIGVTRRDVERAVAATGRVAVALDGVSDPYDIEGVCARLDPMNS